MRLGLCLLFVSSLVPLSAPAQSDPQPDGIGIYFDYAACIPAAWTLQPDEEVVAFLCLTNCSDPVGQVGWACRLDWGPLVPAIEYCYGFMNFATPPFFVCAPQHQDPMLRAPVMLLAAFTFSIPTPGDSVPFRISPHPDFGLMYASPLPPNHYVQMYPSSGAFDRPIGTINAARPIQSEETTWGG